MTATSAETRRPIPDGWDRVALALIPFGAVMLACVSTSATALAESQPDVLLYFKDAALFARGWLPYSGFPFEYPPLALVPMALPWLAWPGGFPSVLDYEWLFAFQNALLAGLVGLMVGWIAAQRGSGAWSYRSLALWGLIAVIEAPVLAWRFDIAAVALAVLGVVLVLKGRPAFAGVALAVGTLVKVFPVALVPVLFAWLLVRRDRGQAIRLAAGFAVAGAVLLGAVVLAVGVEPARQFLPYQQDRLVQIESVMSSALLLVHTITRESVSVDYGYQSIQIVGAGTDQFLAIQDILMAVAIGGVGLLAYLRFRSERRAGADPALATLLAYLAAAVLGLLVTNKVFSAQYLLWLLPLGVLLPRRQAGILVVVAILSIVVFPLSYAQLFRLEVPAILTLAVRNTLLLGLLAWALIRFRPIRRPAIAAAAADVGKASKAAGTGVGPTTLPGALPDAGGSAVPAAVAGAGRAVVPGSSSLGAAAADPPATASRSFTPPQT